MAITIDNLRIVPYQQKDTYKPIWGDTLDFSFVLPSAHADGDKYCFGCDFERVVYPPMRPLCAYTEDFEITTTDAGQVISLSLVFTTARFRDWVCRLKKPTPITLQLVRIRDEVQETLLLDDILALPSVVDGKNIVCPGDPLEGLLAEKLDKPATPGTSGQYLALGPDGETVWKDGSGGGGGGGDVQADWDESDSDDPAYIRNKPTIPAPQVQADWDESDSEDVAYIQHKPTIPPAQVQADWDESDSDSPAYIQHKPSLAPVAVSGSYADLTGKPDLDSEQVATSTDATLTLAPDSAGVTDWSPVADATLTLGAGWGAAKEYYYCVYLNLAQNATLTLGAGLVFDNSQGTADSVAGGYTNVLLVCVRSTGGIVSVLNQRSA